MSEIELHESRFITPDVKRFVFGEYIVYAKRTTHVADDDDGDEIWPTRRWTYFVPDSATLSGDKKIEHDVLKKYFFGCFAVLSLNNEDFFQATDSEVVKDLCERGINHTEQTWRKVVNEKTRRLDAMDNESGQPVVRQQQERLEWSVRKKRRSRKPNAEVSGGGGAGSREGSVPNGGSSGIGRGGGGISGGGSGTSNGSGSEEGEKNPMSLIHYRLNVHFFVGCLTPALENIIFWNEGWGSKFSIEAVNGL